MARMKQWTKLATRLATMSAFCTYFLACAADATPLPEAVTATDPALSTENAAPLSDALPMREDPAAVSADGPATRKPCTSSFGNGLSGSFGRLDGYVAAIVPPGSGRACSSDRNHLHLQVVVANQTYDVAINVDGGFIAEKDAPLPGAPWAEGWHKGGSLSYPTDLGLHASSFTPGSLGQLAQTLESALANANHVSVYATTYNHSGAHLVHRSNKGTTDGAVVVQPLSQAAHIYAFRFASSSF